MKLLKNELEYRTWMVEHVLEQDEESDSAKASDQLEAELVRQMPERFPCVACIVKGSDESEPDSVTFLSPEQIAQWSAEMGMLK